MSFSVEFGDNRRNINGKQSLPKIGLKLVDVIIIYTSDLRGCSLKPRETLNGVLLNQRRYRLSLVHRRSDGGISMTKAGRLSTDITTY